MSSSERSPVAAERFRQISRTYSTTGSLPSSNSSPVSSPTSAVVPPSFTLTFPIINQQNRSESSPNKPGKFSSSQTENQQRRPKLKNNSKKDIYTQNVAGKKGLNTSSNNGFPFTISNILEKEQQRNSRKQQDTTDEQIEEDAQPNMIDTHPLIYERKNDIEKLLVNNVENIVGDNKKKNSPSSEKTSFPTISWTMDVVAPKINTSEEIDEDYDA